MVKGHLIKSRWYGFLFQLYSLLPVSSWANCSLLYKLGVMRVLISKAAVKNLSKILNAKCLTGCMEYSKGLIYTSYNNNNPI